MRKAVATKDLHYENANDIATFLNSSFSHNSTKMHYELTSDEINYVTGSTIKAKDCWKQHIIVFFPNGTIQVKENISIGIRCLQGNLMNFEFEPRKQVNSNYLDSSNIETDDAKESDYEIEEEPENQRKLFTGNDSM